MMGISMKFRVCISELGWMIFCFKGKPTMRFAPLYRCFRASSLDHTKVGCHREPTALAKPCGYEVRNALTAVTSAGVPPKR